MKQNKIIIILMLCVLCLSNIAYAESASTEYKTACGFVRVTTNMLGYNLITRHIAQNVIKKSLNKNIKGDYDVKIDSFSGVDLKKGKFKGLTIDGVNLCMDDGVYITHLFMQTTSDFNYVDYRKKPVEFKVDMPMKYIVEISEDDLNKTVAKDSFFDTFSSLIPLVQVDRFKFKLENNKVKMYTAIHFPFSKAIKFSISGSPKVEDGKIVMSDVETSGTKQEFTDKLTELMNNYNLLENIKLNLFENTDTSMSVKTIKIVDKKIYIDGTVIIKKA